MLHVARALGASDFRIMFRHILPNSLTPIIVASTFGIPQAILALAALGFLGLGAQPPIPEWGAMVNTGKEFIFQDPWLITWPGVCIGLVVLSFNFVGDGLRDALDPRSQGGQTGMSIPIAAALKRVPSYNRFMTVDELFASARGVAAQHPQLASCREIGVSTDGESIPMVTIGRGDRAVLLVACPHPNEPIGAMLVQFLLDELIERDDLRGGWTWHLVPCIDPDGTRLNEGWFGGPFTLRHYARHFYRPWSQEQVEWTFPCRYKRFVWDTPLPETRALMQVFQEDRPCFVYPLHNAGFGGVYYYLSKDLKAVYEALYRIPRELGLVLSLGEPEMPWAVEFAPAIYRLPSVRDAYDYHERYAPGNPAELIAGGGSSFDYLTSLTGEHRVPVELITEVPYFQSPDISDQTPIAETKRDIILEGIERTRSFLAELSAVLAATAGELPGDTRLTRAVASFVVQQSKSLDSKQTWRGWPTA